MGLIRLLLAISVVLAHSGPVFGISLVGGQVAVQAFYIISGFYISLILHEKYIGKNGSYQLFITNRFMRLFPIYWCVLFLSLVVSLVFRTHIGNEVVGGVRFYSLYYDTMSFSSLLFLIFTNIFLVFQDVVMFLGLNTGTGNLYFTQDFRTSDPQLHYFLFVPQAWTIGVEIAFYLIAPFILKRNIKFVLLLLFASLVLRFLIYNNGFKFDPWTYRCFPLELFFFLLGNISYRIYKKIQDKDISKFISFFGIAGLFLFCLFFTYLAIPHKFILFIITFFCIIPLAFKVTKNCAWDNWLGELSYPVYISHILILSLIVRLEVPVVGNLGLMLTILTLTFSIILNRTLAKRIEIIRQGRVVKEIEMVEGVRDIKQVSVA